MRKAKRFMLTSHLVLTFFSLLNMQHIAGWTVFIATAARTIDLFAMLYNVVKLYRID